MLFETTLNSIDSVGIFETITQYQQSLGLREPLFYDESTLINYLSHEVFLKTSSSLSHYTHQAETKSEEKERAFEGLLALFDALKPHQHFLKKRYTLFLTPTIFPHVIRQSFRFMKNLLQALKLPSTLSYQAWLSTCFVSCFWTFLKDDSLDDEELLVKLDQVLSKQKWWAITSNSPLGC